MSHDRDCEHAEQLIAENRLAGPLLLAALGAAALITAATGVLDLLAVRLVLALAGGAALGAGLEAAGRLRGQRQVARWWRTSLNDHSR